jgi:serine/threonine protein kinase
MNGGVYETSCRGVAVAWKRRYCRRQVDAKELREIDILKKLDHQHIIKLVGTYTQEPFLGLLLWPVAACDLGTFLEDADHIVTNAVDNAATIDSESATHRLGQLGFDMSQDMQSLRDAAKMRLKQSIGCISSAIAYLHENRIRHKDVKPSNILLSRDGLWVADFGSSTDFSTLTESVTQNGERGTPKYFAPEVAQFEPNGRFADIFSLGCVFLEMIGLCNGYSLEFMKTLRPEKDCSFHANLDNILYWFDFSGTAVGTSVDQHLMALVRQMLSLSPEQRPTAFEIGTRLRLLDGFRMPTRSMPLWGPCCDPAVSPTPGAGETPEGENLSENGNSWPVTIVLGNLHTMDGQRNLWKLFIKPSVDDIIDKIHVFLVSASDLAGLRNPFRPHTFPNAFLKTRLTWP